MLRKDVYKRQLVDDTVDAANEYSKYPLDNYQLDFYAVSYTHLDVYKRQTDDTIANRISIEDVQAKDGRLRLMENIWWE